VPYGLAGGRAGTPSRNVLNPGTEERMLRDVMEEKISPAYARREYGVAIDERTWTIVPEETARLRAAAQTSR
jgi:N-methylhydantoinase B/oxoprolinase/acetone carboxylase alpha subunit